MDSYRLSLSFTETECGLHIIFVIQKEDKNSYMLTQTHAYIYMSVGCIVLVINKSTTKQSNMRQHVIKAY